MPTKKHRYIIETTEQFEIHSARINMATGQNSMGYVGSYDTIEEAKEKIKELQKGLIEGSKVDPNQVFVFDSESKLVYFNQVDRTVGCYWVTPTEIENERHILQMKDEAAPKLPEYKATITNDDRFNKVEYQSSGLYDISQIMADDISKKAGVPRENLIVGISDDKRVIDIYEISPPAHPAEEVTIVYRWTASVETEDGSYEQADPAEGGESEEATSSSFEPDTKDPEEAAPAAEEPASTAAYPTPDPEPGKEKSDEENSTPASPDPEPEAEEELTESDEDEDEETNYALLMTINEKSSFDSADITNHLEDSGIAIKAFKVDESNNQFWYVEFDGAMVCSDWDKVSEMYQKLCRELLTAFKEAEPKTEPFSEENGNTGIHIMGTKPGVKCGCTMWITVPEDPTFEEE